MEGGDGAGGASGIPPSDSSCTIMTTRSEAGSITRYRFCCGQHPKVAVSSQLMSCWRTKFEVPANSAAVSASISGTASTTVPPTPPPAPEPTGRPSAAASDSNVAPAPPPACPGMSDSNVAPAPPPARAGMSDSNVAPPPKAGLASPAIALERARPPAPPPPRIPPENLTRPEGHRRGERRRILLRGEAGGEKDAGG